MRPFYFILIKFPAANQMHASLIFWRKIPPYQSRFFFAALFGAFSSSL